MEKYHVFAIKKIAYKIYQDNPKSLYTALYNLYNFNKKDLKLGLSIYNEICYTINTKKLKEYIELLPITRSVKSKYLINKNIIEIRPSNIIIKYEKINEDIIYVLKNYYSTLFACDFENNKYYWINQL